MRPFNFVVILICLITSTVAACAADARCNKPPYGGAIEKFQRFVETFGHIVVPTDVLPKLCNAKFGGGSRTGLYNLGITDPQIDERDTSDLAVDMIVSLKKLADKIK